MNANLSNLKRKLLEFLSFFGKIIQNISLSKKLFLGFLLLLFFFLPFLQMYKKEEARKKLSNAKSIFDLEKLIRNYPKTDSAGSAVLFLAKRQWNLGERETAILTLRKGSKNKKYPLLYSICLLKAKYEFYQGRKQVAEETLQKFLSSQKRNSFYPLVLIHLADIQKLNSKTEEARKNYQKVIQEDSNTLFQETAINRLLLLEIPTDNEES